MFFNKTYDAKVKNCIFLEFHCKSYFSWKNSLRNLKSITNLKRFDQKVGAFFQANAFHILYLYSGGYKWVIIFFVNFFTSLSYLKYITALRKDVKPLTNNVSYHIETSQLICNASQLTCFYMMGNIGC